MPFDLCVDAGGRGRTDKGTHILYDRANTIFMGLSRSNGDGTGRGKSKENPAQCGVNMWPCVSTPLSSDDDA